MRREYFRALASSVFAAIVLAGGPTGGAKEKHDFIRIAASAVHWHDVPGGHGVQEAILFGDPDKAEMYVIRVKFPPHLMDLPHWHPNDRFVTVLEGTWYTGTARAVLLGPGSFMMHPAKAVHWDGSRGDETVVVQIIGYGPGTSTLVDTTKSFWIEVPH